MAGNRAKTVVSTQSISDEALWSDIDFGNPEASMDDSTKFPDYVQFVENNPMIRKPDFVHHIVS